MIVVKSMKNILSGAMFLGAGLAVVVGSRRYAMGTPAQMGPGYLPFYLGWVLAGLGAVVLLTGFARPGRQSEGQQSRIGFSLGSPVLVFVSVMLFALSLKSLGLIVATILAVVVSSLGSGEFHAKEVGVYAAALAVLVWGIFALGLQVTMPIWPVWFGG